MALTDDERRVAADAADRFPKGHADYWLVRGEGWDRKVFVQIHAALAEIDRDATALEGATPSIAVAVRRGTLTAEAVGRAEADLTNFFHDRNCGYYHSWLSNSPDLCASIIRSGPPPIGDPEELARC